MTWTSVLSSLKDSFFVFYGFKNNHRCKSTNIYFFPGQTLVFVFWREKRLDFFIFIFSQATWSSFYLRRANEQILLSVVVKVANFFILFSLLFSWTKAFFCTIYFVSCIFFRFFFSPIQFLDGILWVPLSIRISKWITQILKERSEINGVTLQKGAVFTPRDTLSFPLKRARTKENAQFSGFVKIKREKNRCWGWKMDKLLFSNFGTHLGYM